LIELLQFLVACPVVRIVPLHLSLQILASPVLLNRVYLSELLSNGRGSFPACIDALIEQIRVEGVVHTLLIVEVVVVDDFLLRVRLVRGVVPAHWQCVGCHLFLMLFEGVDLGALGCLGVCDRILPVGVCSVRGSFYHSVSDCS